MTDSLTLPIISPTGQRTARVRVVDGVVTFKPQGCAEGGLKVPASLLGPGAALYVDGAESNPGTVQQIAAQGPEVTKPKRRA